MARGGSRDGAGRPRGKPNRRSLADRAAVLAAGAMTPLSYGIRILNDERVSAERRDKMCALLLPYFHSRLNSVAWLPDPTADWFEPDKDAALAMVRRLMRKPKRAAVNGGTPNALEEDR